ncbi:MAG TPA: hypothetical protein VMU92_06100 [Acidobacteriaceae bacterium]|nr:hypothetical protein [Acidobacteriaceae bacterium]
MHALSPTYYIIFTAVMAVGVLLQAFVLVAIYIAIRRSSGKLQATLDEVKTKVLPTLDSAQSLLDDVSPKLKTATSNLNEVSEVLRRQANHVNATVESLLDKTNVQINRVDDMVTATFNALGQASRAIDLAIALPARRVTGILRGLKAGVEVLMGSRKTIDSTSSVEAPVAEAMEVEAVAAGQPAAAKAPTKSPSEKSSAKAEQKQA